MGDRLGPEYAVKEVQALARHATAEMSMNIYGRTRTDRLSELAEAVGNVIFDADSSEECSKFALPQAVGCETAYPDAGYTDQGGGSNPPFGTRSTTGARLERAPFLFCSGTCLEARDASVLVGRPCIMEKLIHELLVKIGEDPEREGLRKTPERVAESFKYLTVGYRQDPMEILTKAVFAEPYDEMVLCRDIDYYSLCEHHMLPFFGRCHVAYIPNGKIIGLSKIPRLVEVFSRRLQVQERLTSQIAECLMEGLNPLGVAVVMEGLHMCMVMRGVEKQNSFAMTSSMLGVFRTELATRNEFLNLIKLGRAGMER
jgi:GTP cyclohydrolase I